jgi:photosystem II stability/assembly factor-like uncharacterized protein
MSNFSNLTHIASNPVNPALKYVSDQDGHQWESLDGTTFSEFNTGLEGKTPPTAIQCIKKMQNGTIFICGGNTLFPNTGIVGKKVALALDYTFMALSNGMVRGIDFEPMGMIGICGDVNGVLWRTSDGGATWSKVYSATAIYEGVYKVRHNNGAWVAACEKGIILISPDSLTWTRTIVGDVDENLLGYSHIGLDAIGNLVVLGSSGYQLLVSEDGGQSFQTLRHPLQGYGMFFRSIAIINSTSFYAVGDAGVVIFAEKVAGSWAMSQISINTYALLYGCEYSNGILTVVGQGETIQQLVGAHVVREL